MIPCRHPAFAFSSVLVWVACGTPTIKKTDTWALPPQAVPLYFERAQLTLRDGRELEVRDAVVQDSMLYAARVQRSGRVEDTMPAPAFHLRDITAFRFSNNRAGYHGAIWPGMYGGVSGFAIIMSPAAAYLDVHPVVVGVVGAAVGAVTGYSIGSAFYTEWRRYDMDNLRARQSLQHPSAGLSDKETP